MLPNFASVLYYSSLLLKLPNPASVHKQLLVCVLSEYVFNMTISSSVH